VARFPLNRVENLVDLEHEAILHGAGGRHREVTKRVTRPRGLPQRGRDSPTAGLTWLIPGTKFPLSHCIPSRVARDPEGCAQEMTK
jgi:hypothetical protein